jgi:hypothetical protein
MRIKILVIFLAGLTLLGTTMSSLKSANAQTDGAKKVAPNFQEKLPPSDGNTDCALRRRAYDKAVARKKCAETCTLSCKSEADILRGCATYADLSCK